METDVFILGTKKSMGKDSQLAISSQCLQICIFFIKILFSFLLFFLTLVHKFQSSTYEDCTIEVQFDGGHYRCQNVPFVMTNNEDVDQCAEKAYNRGLDYFSHLDRPNNGVMKCRLPAAQDSYELCNAAETAWEWKVYRLTDCHPSGNTSSEGEEVFRSDNFRQYPSRWYYWNKSFTPSFLKDAKYIFGELPRLLTPNETPQRKLQVNQSAWYTPDPQRPRFPFSDGTNPSILQLKDNPRIKLSIRSMFPQQAYYLATIGMTDSQCSWHASPEEMVQYNLSDRATPATLRTLLLVLDREFHSVLQLNIVHSLDSNFGRIPIADAPQMFQMDDSRLLTHDGEVYVHYREINIFEYHGVVLSRFSFGFDSQQKLTATLLASESTFIGGGRNFAFIDAKDVRSEIKRDEHSRLPLFAVIRIDPLIVTDVWKFKPLESMHALSPIHIHGTNGAMLPISKTGELLAIGHFHRPNLREKNRYARWGHHYSHSFYTISDRQPFELKRLSPEFLFPSHVYSDNAEIIQFWSGLAFAVGTQDTLVVTYGINDCEGAALTLSWSVVDKLLRLVSRGAQISDFLSNTETFNIGTAAALEASSSLTFCKPSGFHKCKPSLGFFTRITTSMRS